jgi:hypothetical protein
LVPSDPLITKNIILFPTGLNLKKRKRNKADEAKTRRFLWFGQVVMETFWKQFRLPDTRIFSPRVVPRLSVTIDHYWYLFKRFTAFPVGRFHRFEHIVTDSSGKVVAK